MYCGRSITTHLQGCCRHLFRASLPTPTGGFFKRKQLVLSGEVRKFSRTLTTTKYHLLSDHVPIKVSPEVEDGFQSAMKPIIALESTIISHGMPYPENIKTAQEVEQIIRNAGGIPATIAILDGIIHVGLNEKEFEIIGGGKMQTKKVYKCTTRELPHILSSKSHGATTVASTMKLTDLCNKYMRDKFNYFRQRGKDSSNSNYFNGIQVFVTGGIGGVHRGVEATMDVSADLTELGRTPITVVCAGIKSILDIPRTLEYLETQSVPVLSYNCDEFPAFFTRQSGVPSPLNYTDINSIANLIYTSNNVLQLRNGVLVAVPPPTLNENNVKNIEEESGLFIEKAIQDSILLASQKGIQGKDVTPFILNEVKARTGGLSLEVNIALIKNNAKIGTEIAKQLLALKRKEEE